MRVEDGSKVSRDSNVGVKKIHPGDSVVVQGAKHGSTVKASSIAATESGVETSAAVDCRCPVAVKAAAKAAPRSNSSANETADAHSNNSERRGNDEDETPKWQSPGERACSG